jgi:hypothetical protein
MRLIGIILIFSLLVAYLFPGISNPDKPLKGEWDLKPEKVWEITSAGNDPLARPLIRVSEDGTCYIIDKQTKKNYIFDGSGKFIKSFAPRGEGPQEVMRNMAIYYVDGQLIMLDLSKIHYLAKSGEITRSIRHDAFANFLYLCVDPHRCITVTINPLGEKRRERELRLMDIETGKIKTLYRYQYRTLYNNEENQNWGVLEVPGITPWEIVGYDYVNKKVYFGMNNSYTIHVFDLEGKSLNSFSLKRARQEVSKKSIEAWVKATRPEVPYQQVANKIPTELNYFHTIQIIAGLVYVYTMEWGEPMLWSNRWGIQQIDIFSLDGKYLYRTYFNPGKGYKIYFPIPIQLGFIQGGHFYVTLEDESGEIILAKYKISLPKS